MNYEMRAGRHVLSSSSDGGRLLPAAAAMVRASHAESEDAKMAAG